MTPPGPEAAALGGPPVAARAPSFWRTLFASSGPAYLVAVGYMDPGNWATGLAAGSSFGYRLLSVVLIANIAALFFQGLAAKLGLVTGLDLAQACRLRYGKATRLFLWLLCELAIVACDLAELVGSAIALKLLFGLPLLVGICLTSAFVLVVLGLQRRGYRQLEAIVVALLLFVALCFAVELVLSRPSMAAIARGLVPDLGIATDANALYLAMGILGATIMPHNLYLHSSIVQVRPLERTESNLRQALRFARLDLAIALSLAFFVNAAIVILAASTFHAGGEFDVQSIEHAYRLLSPFVGVPLAGFLFALALLAAGQNASLTATLAGQIVMEGFTRFTWPVWARRLVARLLAMVPAIGAVLFYGEEATARLLVLSQVVLSLQLPFAIYPLVRLTANRGWMGGHANGLWTNAIAWTLTVLIGGLNLALLLDLLF